MSISSIQFTSQPYKPSFNGYVIGNIKGMRIEVSQNRVSKKATMPDHGTVLSHGPS